MTRIGIILGSTRPNRNGEQVARWVYDIAARRSDAEFELVDLRDYPLPHLDEPLPPSMGQYQNEHTKQWADKIASFDGFVIVTPEYNHSTSGRAEERHRLPVRRVEQQGRRLRLLRRGRRRPGGRAPAPDRRRAADGRRAPAGRAVAVHRLRELQRVQAQRLHVAALNTLLDQVVAWSTALAPLREPAMTAA